MTKKIWFTLLTIGAVIFGAKAQDTKPELPYGLHPGSVTPLDGQVIQGYVVKSDNIGNQKECVFYADYHDGRSRKVYHPNDLLGYTIENNQYKTIAYNGNIGFGKPSKNFFLVTKPGAIVAYIYWAPQQQVFWQKGDEEPVSNASMFMGFKKNVLKLVGDDADLAGKIDRKESGYGMTGMVQIVDEYNAWAAAKK